MLAVGLTGDTRTSRNVGRTQDPFLLRRKGVFCFPNGVRRQEGGLEPHRHPERRKNRPELNRLDIGIAIAAEPVAVGLDVGEIENVADIEECGSRKSCNFEILSKGDCAKELMLTHQAQLADGYRNRNATSS